MRLLAELWLFFRRDLAIARSYRAAFLLEGAGTLFGAAMIYYVARLVDSPALAQALPQRGSYFAFALVGFAFFDYLGVALDTFDRSLEEARSTGTLEPLLVTQTSLPVILAGSAIYPFAATTLRVAVYLIWGGALFGLPLGRANWFGVVVILLASVLAFSGLGIFSASYLLLFKRGSPAKWLVLGLSGLASGMLFPVSILPGWLQFLARLNPVTYALNAARSALLAGASLGELLRPIGILLLFAAILLPASMAAFAAALRRTKTTGTLTHT
ncbi:MAG TPA: ABC transporter permease [Methylomirabilota bacterium]|nr:ABC transporter permease [Methylomirabilota bacterium]